MEKQRAPYALAALAVVALDQSTKLLVRRLLPVHHDQPVVDGLLSLRRGENPGVAFGLLSGAPLPYQAGILTALGALAVVLLVAYAGRLPPRPRLPQIALALMMGGAAGNLLDRVRLGVVVDFVHLYWREHQWPDFNVADSAISVGVVLLAFGLGRSDRMPRS